jgi:natural product precursor
MRRVSMKKLQKLALKKITLKDLNETKLDQVAGGLSDTGCIKCPTGYKTCFGPSCPDVC